MKKIFVSLVTLLLFIPVVVNAETCDNNKVYIDSIKLDQSRNVEELANATADGKNINLNLEMSDLGDSIKYKIIIKNDSNNDYELDQNNIKLNSEYINYTIELSDNSSIVKAKSSKLVYLNVQYATPVPDNSFENGVLKDNITMKVNLSTENSITNPNTGLRSLSFIVFIIMIMSISFIILKKKRIAKIMIVIGTVILIPLGVNALCKCELNINSNVTIKEPKYLYTYMMQTIGETVDNQYTFDNLEDALETFNHDYIVKIKVDKNNIIKEAGIIFVIDNNTYYLYGGDNKISYETKKNQIIDIFGQDNCEMVNIYNSYDGYLCTNGHLSVRVYGNGFVSIADEHYYCLVDENKNTLCFND